MTLPNTTPKHQQKVNTRINNEKKRREDAKKNINQTITSKIYFLQPTGKPLEASGDSQSHALGGDFEGLTKKENKKLKSDYDHVVSNEFASHFETAINQCKDSVSTCEWDSEKAIQVHEDVDYSLHIESSDVELQQIECRYKVELIRINYVQERHMNQLIRLLKAQLKLRLVTQSEAERKVTRLASEFNSTKQALKTFVCGIISERQEKARPAKRKRQTLSKHATSLLETWFFNHLNHPYPSEQEKADLAKSCNLTTQQINNWFGNKRIRYKRKVDGNKTQKKGKSAKRRKIQKSTLGM
mmetsp:Transcript_29327/g.32579  ORF Transcript_29327/g.32579 Transcript_29327/m.32579 type:complete len:299 (-) Transcript_29327:150-1046(-)